jgi:hypothetical protein
VILLKDPVISENKLDAELDLRGFVLGRLFLSLDQELRLSGSSPSTPGSVENAPDADDFPLSTRSTIV